MPECVRNERTNERTTDGRNERRRTDGNERRDRRGTNARTNVRTDRSTDGPTVRARERIRSFRSMRCMNERMNRDGVSAMKLGILQRWTEFCQRKTRPSGTHGGSGSAVMSERPNGRSTQRTERRNPIKKNQPRVQISNPFSLNVSIYASLWFAYTPANCSLCPISLTTARIRASMHCIADTPLCDCTVDQ